MGGQRRSRAESRRRMEILEAEARRLPEDPAGAWRLEAACRGLEVEDFYPVSADAAAWPQRICRNCPVQVPCYADRDQWGIWGGTTESERRDFERAKARVAGAA
jgi:hypothetical protein